MFALVAAACGSEVDAADEKPLSTDATTEIVEGQDAVPVNEVAAPEDVVATPKDVGHDNGPGVDSQCPMALVKQPISSTVYQAHMPIDVTVSDPSGVLSVRVTHAATGAVIADFALVDEGFGPQVLSRTVDICRFKGKQSFALRVEDRLGNTCTTELKAEIVGCPIWDSGPQIPVSGVGQLHDVTVADADGDDVADVVIATDSGLSVLLGEDAGQLGFPQRLWEAESPVLQVHAADLNGDGRVDFVLRTSEQLAVVLQSETCTPDPQFDPSGVSDEQLAALEHPVRCTPGLRLAETHALPASAVASAFGHVVADQSPSGAAEARKDLTVLLASGELNVGLLVREEGVTSHAGLQTPLCTVWAERFDGFGQLSPPAAHEVTRCFQEPRWLPGPAGAGLMGIWESPDDARVLVGHPEKTALTRYIVSNNTLQPGPELVLPGRAQAIATIGDDLLVAIDERIQRIAADGTLVWEGCTIGPLSALSSISDTAVGVTSAGGALWSFGPQAQISRGVSGASAIAVGDVTTDGQPDVVLLGASVVAVLPGHDGSWGAAIQPPSQPACGAIPTLAAAGIQGGDSVVAVGKADGVNWPISKSQDGAVTWLLRAATTHRCTGECVSDPTSKGAITALASVGEDMWVLTASLSPTSPNLLRLSGEALAAQELPAPELAEDGPWVALGAPVGAGLAVGSVECAGAPHGVVLTTSSLSIVDGAQAALATPGLGLHVGGAITVLTAGGVSTFTVDESCAPVFAGLTLGAFVASATHDLDGDGAEELFAAHPDGTISIYQGVGPGTFGDVTGGLSAGAALTQIGLVDVNGDGRVDLVGLDPAGRQLLTFAGTATGFHSDPRSVHLGTDPLGFDAADIDGDGCVDLVVGLAGSGGALILRNQWAAVGLGCSPVP